MFTVLLILVAVVSLVILFVVISYIRIWAKAVVAGCPIGLPELMAMKLRGTPPERIVDACVLAARGGVAVSVADLEAHYLAGGSPEKAVRSMVRARGCGKALTFAEAAKADLTGDG